MKQIRLLVLDRNGHTTVDQDVVTEYRRLITNGYAAFVNNIQVDRLPTSGDVLMLGPIVGG